jgi:hypothetical protein
MLSSFMLNVILLGVVMLNVVAPLQHLKTVQLSESFFICKGQIWRWSRPFCEMLNYFNFLKVIFEKCRILSTPRNFCN